MHFFFEFDFLVFFGHGGISAAAGVALSGGARKLSARRSASLRPSAGDPSLANCGETLADPVRVNRDELGRATWGKGQALLHGALCFDHLGDSFCVGPVANLASR